MNYRSKSGRTFQRPVVLRHFKEPAFYYSVKILWFIVSVLQGMRLKKICSIFSWKSIKNVYEKSIVMYLIFWSKSIKHMISSRQNWQLKLFIHKRSRTLYKFAQRTLLVFGQFDICLWFDVLVIRLNDVCFVLGLAEIKT